MENVIPICIGTCLGAIVIGLAAAGALAGGVDLPYLE